MNTRGVMEMLTDKDEETGEYVIPHIIYSDRYSSEMVAFADLVLPDTTYLERHDCISLLDRPICEADAVADSNPLARCGARPRRARFPVRAGAVGGQSWLAGLCERRRLGQVRRLRRLHRQPRAAVPVLGRWQVGAVKTSRAGAGVTSEPQAARALYRERRLLDGARSR